jgi:hypothetical protein
MKTPLARAAVLAGCVSALLGVLHLMGVGLPLLGGLAVAFALVAGVAPRVGVRWLDDMVHQIRAALWRSEQGRHHSFGGITLQIHDDGQFVWLPVADLQLLLHTTEPEDVTAARHSGRWRRDDAGVLQLRVDAVVAGLSSGPVSLEPRVIRLRRYLEREVLFPAAERRRRSR